MIEALYRAVATALADPAVRKSLTDLGIDVEGTTPQEFGAFIAHEFNKWTAVGKAANVRID